MTVGINNKNWMSSGSVFSFLKHVVLITTILLFIISILLWTFFDPSICTFQYVCALQYGSNSIYFGIDGISMCLILLTSFFMPLCILSTWNNVHNNTEYVLCLLSIEILLWLVFSVLHLIFFYIFFESILIPFFIMIGMRGSMERKTHAAYMLFFYTLCGSIVMLVAICVLFVHAGSTYYVLLWDAEFSNSMEYVLWMAFFLAFAIKVPIYPFHLWLPEAHVESPTEGSVVLAAILLKVGGYGILRVLLPIFPNATMYFSPLVITLCIISTIYTSFATMRQTDIKRIIAYSSVAHMSIVLIGIFCISTTSLVGSVVMMFGHGIVSGGLFFLIGILYERHKTKIVFYYTGIVHCMPIFSIFLLTFMLGNISLPGTLNFIGEFLILCSTLWSDNIICVSAIGCSIFVCSFYSLYAYNRISYGLPSNIVIFKDISIIEFAIMLPILIYLIFLGLYPAPLINVLELTCYNISNIYDDC
jgi:NADH-quinone oxidoreductase subunit M